MGVDPKYVNFHANTPTRVLDIVYVPWYYVEMMTKAELRNGYIALDVGKLRDLMDQRGMRQKELAERAELSRVRVSILLRDESARVHIGTERKLASAFGLPAGALDKGNVEASYRNAVVRANDTLDFTGLGIVSTDRPIPMDRGFAPLKVREVREDPSSFERVADEHSSRQGPKRQAPRTIGQALELSQRFFLLADPGAGKTTTLRHLAHTLASGEQRDPSYPADPCHPIYVRLADWAQQLAGDAKVDVVDSAIAQLGAAVVDASSTAQWLRQVLKKGDALVLFDGLDEVPNPDLQTPLNEQLRLFVQTYPKARVVVASRKVGFSKPNLGAEFDQFTIEPLDEEAIVEFVTEWSAFRHEHKSSRECAQCTERSGKLRHAVLDNPRIRTLAGNPMMLTILCLLYDAGATLPQRRWQLYEKIAEAFLFSWEEKKRAGTPGALDHALKLDDREVLWLLKSIALEMQRKDFTIVPRWWLLEHCATFLRAELQFTDEDARSEAEVLVWSLQERAGLLVERGLGRYGFLHLGFQEYFAARAVLAQDDPIDCLQEYVYHPRWREVARLVAAQLDRRPASQLLRNILDDADPTGRFLHRGLLIVLKCLSHGAPGYDSELLRDLKQEIGTLRGTKWLGMAFDVVDVLTELQTTRLQLLSQEALDHLRAAPDRGFSTCVRVHHAMASVKVHAEEAEVDTLEEKDDAKAQWPVHEIPVPDGSESTFVSLSPTRYYAEWAGKAFDQLRSDPSARARAVCAELLSRFSKRRSSVQRGLLEALDEQRESSVCVAIAGALEPAGNAPQVRQKLLHAIDHERDQAVAGACARALRAPAVRDKAVRQKLISIVRGDRPAEVRAGAAGGLQRCVSTDVGLRDLLLTMLKDKTEDDDVRVACLRSLEDVVPSHGDASDSLIPLLAESPRARLPGVVAQVLAEYAAGGRVEWSRLPIERIEHVLVALTRPFPRALAALRGLVDARELRKCGIPREARIKQALADVADRISCCFVFGSAARGDQGSESDIDLMVIGDASLRDLTPGLKRAEQQLGKQVNAVVYSADEWNQRCREKNPFVMEVLRGKRKFVKGGQDELAAMA